MGKSNRIQYIAGLKGIACLAVMIGHLAGIAKYATSADFYLPIFGVLFSRPFKVLFHETFWLYLFFLASGFLLALGRIESISALIQKIIRRFLRLGIPILFASAVIYVLWMLAGMHSAQTDALFANAWYQGAYASPAGIVDVLLSPIHVLILGKTVFNSPYWVLREMLVASILIYLCIYVQSKFESRPWAKYLLAYGCAVIAYFLSGVVLTCVLGFLLAQHRGLAKWIMERAKWLGVVVLAVCAVYAVLYPKPFSAILFFGAMIPLTPSIPKLERALSHPLLMKLEGISFGIYSFHWPVACSVGAWVLLVTWKFGAGWSLLLCGVVSSGITFLISHLFRLTAERWSAAITQRIMNVITPAAHYK